MQRWVCSKSNLPEIWCSALAILIKFKEPVCAETVSDKENEALGGRRHGRPVRGHAVYEWWGEVDVKDGVEEDQVHKEAHSHQPPVHHHGDGL